MLTAKWARPIARVGIGTIVLLFTTGMLFASGKDIDLDGKSENGNESRCELHVISTFPTQVENVITNRAEGDLFDFSWPSAGPGGFSSSATAGTPEGVGTKWTWSTNESVVSFSGSTCEDDICFLQTGGPDPAVKTCSRGCLDDGVSLVVGKGSAGEALLDWTGGDPDYTVWRSNEAAMVAADGNDLITTSSLSYVDSAPLPDVNFYLVRASTCNTLKSCETNADCNEPSEGTCVSDGPFVCPGRTLASNAGQITVSSASLTSSLITFFSPPKSNFDIETIARPGGVLEIYTNRTDDTVLLQSPETPPGCCPEDPNVPDQLRCGDDCVDYLNDPNNCGACGNVCGEGTCCSNGNCVSTCPEGQVLCDGLCVDLMNDSDNCGACGAVCEGDTCCDQGVCAGFCENPDETYCGDGLCADLQNDDANCGACGNECPEGTCCFQGSCESVCIEAETYCEGECADLQNDNTNCGSCGATCTGDTCCFGGVCASFCDPGEEYCPDGNCADLLNDSQNCGACGNTCPEGTCCQGGVCTSECGPDRTYCPDGLCYDLMNDPENCGACGNSCGDSAICDAGVCVPCGNQGGRTTACDNRCVNLNTDAYNCGECGNSCQEQCPSNFTGVCSNGESCRCDAGVPPPPPPPNSPVPTEPVCPNENPSVAEPGGCPNPNLTGPQPTACPNENPTTANPGGCPNPNPTSSTVPVCPDPGPPAPSVTPTPICDAPAIDQQVAPGETVEICRPGSLLFTETIGTAKACGESIPGPRGECGAGETNVSEGTFMRFVPVDDSIINNAFATPFAVHVTSDSSGDYLIAPGETATLVIDILNAGPMDMLGTQATIITEPVDLSRDGVENPVELNFTVGSSLYGTIPGTQPSVDCEPITLQPASNEIEFQVTVPSDHPPDTAHPFTMRFNATVDGQPFTMDMPISIGIVDVCDITEGAGDFDGVDGLLNPLTDLVPAGDPVPFPNKSLNAGKTVPLKMRLLCGGIELKGADILAPEIVGISEETQGPLNLATLNLNNDDPGSDDLSFRFNETTKQWIFNLRSDDLGTGFFTIEILVGGRKSYFSGFELR